VKNTQIAKTFVRPLFEHMILILGLLLILIDTSFILAYS